MALQTSGQISLADIQTEFGGSNPISISEYYGAAAGIPASGVISIGDFYGASAVTNWTSDITKGQQTAQYVTWRGYSSTLPIGSITDNTVDNLGGATVRQVASLNNSTLFLEINGNHPNSGWTSIDMGPYNFTRASAGYNYNSSNNYTQWSWTGISSTDPFFVSNGVVVSVVMNP